MKPYFPELEKNENGSSQRFTPGGDLSVLEPFSPRDIDFIKDFSEERFPTDDRHVGRQQFLETPGVDTSGKLGNA